MQDEISVKPLVDILSEQLKERVVMSGSGYVLFDSKIRVKQSDVDTAISEQSVLYMKELQDNKLSELEIAYNNANFLDIAYMKTTFQANKKSQDLITGILAGGAVPSNFTWRDKLNVDVSMTFAEFQGLSQDIVARGQVNWTKFQDLKAKVKLAKKQADLDLVVW